MANEQSTASLPTGIVEQLREYLQHKPDCRSSLCYKCDMGEGNDLHKPLGNIVAHKFAPAGCTCGLAALLQPEDGTT